MIKMQMNECLAKLTKLQEVTKWMLI